MLIIELMYQCRLMYHYMLTHNLPGFRILLSSFLCWWYKTNILLSQELQASALSWLSADALLLIRSLLKYSNIQIFTFHRSVTVFSPMVSRWSNNTFTYSKLDNNDWSFCEDVYIFTVCIDRYSMISMYNHTWNWFHKLLCSGLCVYFWLFCWWFFLSLLLFPVLQCGVWQEAGLTLVKQQQGTPVPLLIKLTIKDRLYRLACSLMSHIPAFFCSVVICICIVIPYITDNPEQL